MYKVTSKTRFDVLLGRVVGVYEKRRSDVFRSKINLLVAHKTKITMVSQIKYYNDTHNVYISSKNLLMLAPLIVAIIVTQNLLAWNQDGRRRVSHDLIFVLKILKKSSQNLKKERRFWITKIFEKLFFLCTFSYFCRKDKDIF